MTLWLTIIGMGIVTYGVRLLPFVIVERVEVPERIRDAMKFVPVAVLSAIVAQEILAPGGDTDISFDNLRLVAGVFAIVIAALVRRVLVTIAAGMLMLWILQGLD